MHFLNKLLPLDGEHQVEIDTERSVNDIEFSINQIDSELFKEDFDVKLSSISLENFNSISVQNIDIKSISKCIRLVANHLELKYSLPKNLRISLVKIFFKVYFIVSNYPKVQIKLLSILVQLAKNPHVDKNDFSYSWRLFWDDVLRHYKNQDIEEISCAENLSKSLLNEKLNFMIKTRHLISGQKNYGNEKELEINEIILKSNNDLNDFQSPCCFQGVLSLVVCLPTNLPSYFDSIDLYKSSNVSYSKFLPVWFNIWSKFDFNIQWDCCWLTLFCRARKFSFDEDLPFWKNPQFLDFLFYKLRQLLNLPVLKNGLSLLFSNFPFEFPGYLKSIFDKAFDADSSRLKSIKKISKLLYFIVSIDEDLITKSDQTKDVELNLSSIQLINFLHSVRSFMSPSNSGTWSLNLFYFLSSFNAQICRHAGRTLLDYLKPIPSDALNHPNDQFLYSKKVNLLISDHLIETYIPYIIEGLYSKSDFSTFICRSSISNICSFNPRFEEFFIPKMIHGLDPLFNGQAQQSLVSIQLINTCFHRLLYPKPVILKYLPDIMRLTLDSVNSNDRKKSTGVLLLYRTIFLLLPMSFNQFNALEFPHLPIDIIRTLGLNTYERSDLLSKTKIFLSDEEMYGYLDATEYILTSWIDDFFDKVFSILERQSQESKDKVDTSILDSLSNCLESIFTSLMLENEKNEKAIQQILTKIIGFFCNSSLTPASKFGARILDAFITCHPSKLSVFIESLLDDDLINLNYATDKIYFRIYLAAGCCKSSQGKALENLESETTRRLLKVITNPRFYHHKDKKIKVVTGKLLRDVLRGSISIYPIYSLSSFDSTSIGSPYVYQKSNVSFYYPSATIMENSSSLLTKTLDMVLKRSIRLLRLVHNNPSTEDVSELFVEFYGKDYYLEFLSDKANESLNNKTIEDILSDYLCIFEKSYRGSTEILADLDSNGFLSNPHIHSFHQYMIDQTKGGVKDFFSHLRRNIMQFLNLFKILLGSISAQSPYASLNTNIFINKQWLKCSNLVLIRRMSNLKDIKQTKRGIKYWKSITRSSIVSVVYKGLKKLSLSSHLDAISDQPNSKLSFELNKHLSSRELSDLSDINYWRSYYLTKDIVSVHSFSQYIKRLSLLAYKSVKFGNSPSHEFGSSTYYTYTNSLENTTSYFSNVIDFNSILSSVNMKDNYMNILLHVISLCQNEYDEIQKTASLVFDSLYPYYWYKFNNSIIKVLLEYSMDANISYYRANMILTIINKGKILSRVCNHIELWDSFINMALLLPNSNVLNSKNPSITAETSPEKIQILNLFFLKTLRTYISVWKHKVDSHNIKYYKMALEKIFVSLGANIDLIDVPLSHSQSLKVQNMKSELISLLLLHHLQYVEVIESLSNEVLDFLCQWLISAVVSPIDSPTKKVTLYILMRFVNMNIIFPDRENKFISRLLTIVGDPSSDSTNFWRNLFSSLAKNRRLDSRSQSEHWSEDIKIIVDVLGDGLIVPLPIDEKFFLDNAKYSLWPASSYFFYSLAIHRPLNESSSNDFFHLVLKTPKKLEEFLSLIDRVDSTSEDDNSSINQLKSEVFSGILKALYSRKRYLQTFDTNINLLKVLSEFFIKNINSISLDYCNPWSDALVYAQISLEDDASDNPITNIIIEQLNSDYLKISRDSKIHASDEGFSRLSKYFLFLFSRLDAIIRKSYFKTPNFQHQQDLASLISKLVQIFDQFQIRTILTYQTVRDNFSFTLSSIMILASSILYENTDLVSKIKVFLAKLLSIDFTDEELIDSNKLTEHTSYIEFVATLINLYLGSVGKNALFHSELCQFASKILSGNSLTNPSVSRKCLSSSILFFNFYFPFTLDSNDKFVSAINYPSDQKVDHNNFFLQFIGILSDNFAKSSRLVREATLKCSTIIMVNKWYLLNDGHRKKVRDIFSQGLLDKNPEVRELAKNGMIQYIIFKPLEEVEKVAQVYIKNSDILFQREKKKKKMMEQDKPLRPDDTFVNTLEMISVIILAYPFDLPSFVPSLISSLLKHGNNSYVKNSIGSTMRSFRMTHQDGWETEFKPKFSSDQILEMQGAGSGSYFS